MRSAPRGVRRLEANAICTADTARAAASRTYRSRRTPMCASPPMPEPLHAAIDATCTRRQGSSRRRMTSHTCQHLPERQISALPHTHLIQTHPNIGTTSLRKDADCVAPFPRSLRERTGVIPGWSEPTKAKMPVFSPRQKETTRAEPTRRPEHPLTDRHRRPWCANWRTHIKDTPDTRALATQLTREGVRSAGLRFNRAISHASRTLKSRCCRSPRHRFALESPHSHDRGIERRNRRLARPHTNRGPPLAPRENRGSQTAPSRIRKGAAESSRRTGHSHPARAPTPNPEKPRLPPRVDVAPPTVRHHGLRRTSASHRVTAPNRGPRFPHRRRHPPGNAADLPSVLSPHPANR